MNALFRWGITLSHLSTLAIASLAITLGGCTTAFPFLSESGSAAEGSATESPQETTSAPAEGSSTSNGAIETTGSSGNPVASNASATTLASTSQAAQSASSTANDQNADREQAEIYQAALDKAYSAARLSQTAKAPSDWEFVATRWQAAIQTLETIPSDRPQAQQAKAKATEYRKNLKYAQQQAATLPKTKPTIVVSRPSDRGTEQQGSNAGNVPKSIEDLGEPVGDLVTQVPIVGRVSGIPVVSVTIDNQTFPMMVDTGASATVITQKMAQLLGVKPKGSVKVKTPSDASADFGVTDVSAISVGSITVGALRVAISPSMEMGLLGQNFFGSYDVMIRRDRVEFHKPR